MLRFGLCCKFEVEPIRFVTTTARSMEALTRRNGRLKLARLAFNNAQALAEAVEFCRYEGIGCFRINSQILPLKTHPRWGYEVEDLPEGDKIITLFREAGRRARQNSVRLTFHPDQFVVLASPDRRVALASRKEIEYQAELASWVGADVVNIHVGGVYGDKAKALARFRRNMERLSDRARSLLTVENDDRSYTPADILPLCQSERLPLVYDVHHHRCFGDNLSVEDATEAALATWNREPLFHISSPVAGWRGAYPEWHHDYIRFSDFPKYWIKLARGIDFTVEVEAKAKELAIRRLRARLQGLETQYSLSDGVKRSGYSRPNNRARKR